MGLIDNVEEEGRRTLTIGFTIMLFHVIYDDLYSICDGRKDKTPDVRKSKLLSLII